MSDITVANYSVNTYPQFTQRDNKSDGTVIHSELNNVKDLIHLACETMSSEKLDFDTIMIKLAEPILSPELEKFFVRLAQINSKEKELHLLSAKSIELREQYRLLGEDRTELIGCMKNSIISQQIVTDKKYNVLQTQLEVEKYNSASEGDEVSCGTSYAELWEKLAIAIAEIKENYVDFYANLMLAYTDMYQEFNETVQAASSSAVSAGDDGNNVSFNAAEMDSGFEAFNKYLKDHEDELGYVDVNQIDNIAPTLKPAFNVAADGKITFNLDQYDQLSHFDSQEGTYPNRYPAGLKDGKVSTTSYQAWQTTFNSCSSAMQSYMQTFFQRYTQANSTFDTINKQLSGSITSLGECAESFLKNQ